MASTKTKKENKGIISLFINAIMTNILSLAEIVFKPYYLLPVIAVGVFSTALFSIIIDIFQRPVIDFVLYFDQIPQDNLLGVILFNYPLEVLAVLILLVVMSVISLTGMFSIIKMVRGTKFMKAINESIADWRKALGITVIFFVVAALFAIALNLMILISTIVDWLGIVLFIGVLLVALILIIKSVFILPALTEEETTKKAIVLGLEFTNRIGIIKFGVLLIFLAIAAIIAITGTVLITQVGIILGDMFYTPAIILAESFATTFFVCAITNYFYSNEKN